MTPADSSLPARLSLADFHQLLQAQHPFAQLLGIEITAIGHGTAEAILPASEDHQRLGGIIAGPMLMGLADLTLYAAVVGATGQPEAVTASLTMNFLRKSPPGAVRAQARLFKTGRLTTGEVTLYPEQGGAAVAHAVSTWSVPKS